MAQVRTSQGFASEGAADRLIAETERFAVVMLKIRRLRRFQVEANATIARRVLQLWWQAKHLESSRVAR